jgi:hypothetical protein
VFIGVVFGLVVRMMAKGIGFVLFA